MRRPLVVFYFWETRIWALPSRVDTESAAWTPILSDSAETSTQLPFYPLDREARSVPVGRRVLQSNDFDTRKHSCHSWYQIHHFLVSRYGLSRLPVLG
ncbi:hypothetical protein BDV09DRAFT_7001 [Aspergillus tetrazonus]